jgi:UPF0755 protein
MTQPRTPSDPYYPANEPQRGTTAGPRSSGYSPRTGTYLARPTTTVRSRRSGGVPGRGVGAIVFLVALAAAVLFGVVSFLGPSLSGMARNVAEGNPEFMRLPFVSDVVRGQLGGALDEPAGSDPAPVRFQVAAGSNAQQIGDDLVRAGLLKERILFTYLVMTRGVAGDLRAGAYSLSQTMTPRQIVDRLQSPPDRTVVFDLRWGLRIEQVTAKLLTVGLQTDLQRFYELANDPPAELRERYPFLQTIPEGRSLEGFLPGGTFTVYPDVSPEALLELLLDEWQERVGGSVVEAARAKGKDFYEVLSLASIVEREAALDRERPLIAGVYQNRLDKGDPPWLNADPTVFYAVDTVNLREIDFEEWPRYAFWTVPDEPLGQIDLPDDLEEFNTYVHKGRIPAPICSPTLASIEAAISPDQKDDYRYFVAKRDGSREHAFARTIEEHRANLRRYGYTP